MCNTFLLQSTLRHIRRSCWTLGLVVLKDEEDGKQKNKMKIDKKDLRKKRKAELMKLSLEELEKINPYRERAVTGIKTDEERNVLLEEMVETILSDEGLGKQHE